MANYVLVENKKIIHLGPVAWRHRFIQSELDDLGVVYPVPPDERGYIKINDHFEIFPVGAAKGELADDRWEHPVGPTWEFIGAEAIPTYAKREKTLEEVRPFIKNIVATIRYNKESSGTKVTVREGVDVTVDTSRDGRAIFVQVYSTMADDATVDWKFPEGWYTLTKTELGIIIAGGFTHIQEQFVWEKTINDNIDASSSMDQLKTIYDELTAAPGVV